MSRARFLLPSLVMSAAALVALLVAPQSASAQYMGENFHGDFGVNAGTQPPPGVFVLIPYGQWNADEIRNADGDRALSAFQGFDLRVIPSTVVVVTKKRILGANYGFMASAIFSKIKPEKVGDAANGSWGFSDTYVVPLFLGWHTARADFVAGYGFFAPTGSFEPGASDNTGLGMWSHEIQGGTTVYMDAGKKFSVATTGYLEMHTKKTGEDLTVGNLLTFEGGAAYNVPKIGGAFGIAYYLQNKISDDSGSDVPVVALRALNLYGHNHLFGIGPDLTMGLFQKGTTVGAVNIKYLWDTSASSSFKGSTFWIGFTVGQIFK